MFTKNIILSIATTLFVAVVLLSQVTRADDSDPVIFDVRRSLPMEPDEPVAHDFYLSVGSEAGIKKGLYLSVVRTAPVHDPIQNKQQALLTVPVGKVQVIHVERNMSVARLVSELDDTERPTLEFEAIMIGDRVDVRSGSMEAPKEPSTSKSRRKKKAAATAPSGSGEISSSAVASSVVSSGASESKAPAPAVTPATSAVSPSASNPAQGAAGATPSPLPGAVPGGQPVEANRVQIGVPPPKAS